MATTSGTETETVPAKLRFVDGGQYLVNGLLYQPVYYGRYSQQTHLAVVLRDFHSKDRIGTVTAVKQRAYQTFLVGEKPWEKVIT